MIGGPNCKSGHTLFLQKWTAGYLQKWTSVDSSCLLIRRPQRPCRGVAKSHFSPFSADPSFRPLPSQHAAGWRVSRAQRPAQDPWAPYRAGARGNPGCNDPGAPFCPGRSVGRKIVRCEAQGTKAESCETRAQIAVSRRLSDLSEAGCRKTINSDVLGRPLRE